MVRPRGSEVRVVFLGTPPSAVPALEALIAADHVVPLVVTQPDRPSGRSAVLQPPAVKRAAFERGIEVLQPAAVRDPTFLESLSRAGPELLVVVAYGRILPGAVIGLPPRGAVNLHFSLLPRYRGAAPVQWALARCEEITGVTTMHMNERMDEGDLLLSRSVSIERGEHAPALTSRLARIGAALLVETLARAEDGSLDPRPQDSSVATYAPRLTSLDGEADFGLTAREIEGRIRGFDPWPGVWAVRGGRRIRLVEASAVAGERLREEPGRVVAREGEAILVSCGGGTRLAVEAIQPEGRRPIRATEAIHGRQIAVGDLLHGASQGKTSGL